ncbi:hypothetical protein BC643_0774 [Mangrovibacterium diazotrophicum]|uniref:Uncharacterized protein n=1 Tax=Mangrovibacterium diazotrophicum TaxID=1261403 RepID=A0A419W4R1_9BACT|nr:hypothetical protein BC643_0774 [Mangrovibacterium diazotrophicum]
MQMCKIYYLDNPNSQLSKKMNNQFEQQQSNWLEKVADGCHNCKTNPEYAMDFDFYACQSDNSN